MTSVELALLDRSQNAREHRVRLCAVFGSVAPTDLAAAQSPATVTALRRGHRIAGVRDRNLTVPARATPP